MENTQIFLVIVATIILIIIAENQKLRNITWILLLGCITYIVLSIELNMEPLVDNPVSNLSNLDTNQVITDQSSNSNSYLIETNIIIDQIVEDSEIIVQPKIVEATQNINILKIATARDVDNKSPIGESKLFLSDEENIICFTAVSNALESNQIIHTWIYDNREYITRNIYIGKSPYWRCWSRITVRPEMVGEWQVIVTDTIGNILDSTSFSIIPDSD